MGKEVVSFTIDDKLSKGEPSWVNYIKGTIFQYLDDLPTPLAINICIASNVPLGSGLSSSASLEVAVATFLEQLCGLSTPGVTKALRCQKAEHDFADTPCGVMDQFISAMGKRGQLLLIDCHSNAYTLIPFGNSKMTRPPVMLITNSNVKHSLADSQYPVRVLQCQAALKALNAKFPDIKTLRHATYVPHSSSICLIHSFVHVCCIMHHVSNIIYSCCVTRMENLEAIQDDVDEVIFRRAMHCISENSRTHIAVDALAAGDFKLVGEQMTRSHASLQEDFEVRFIILFTRLHAITSSELILHCCIPIVICILVLR